MNFLVVAFFAALTLCAQNTEKEMDTRARALLEKGASEDPDSRREVAVALSLIATKDPATKLLEALTRDKDYLTREAAVMAVGELGDPKMAKLLEPALEDEVPEVVFAAARGLYRLKDPRGREALVSIVEKETKAKSGFAKAKMREVKRRLKTPKSALFFAVQQGIGFVPVPGLGAGVSAMTSMLADADFSARATSLLMLSSDKSPEIKALIEDGFDDEDWSVRAACVQLTALRNERRWRTRLIPLLDDNNKKVRFRAAAVLLRLNYGVKK